MRSPLNELPRSLGVAMAFVAGCTAPHSSPPAPPPPPADPAAVLARLDAHKIIEPQGNRPSLSWFREAVETLRPGLVLLRSAERVTHVDEATAIARLRSAQVVLVADLHGFDPCRRAFGRAVVLGSTGDERSAGSVALAFEALPPSVEGDTRAVRSSPPIDGVDPLRIFLAAVWPWPVTAMAALLRRGELLTCPVLGAGREQNLALPPLWTPDAEREPGLSGMTMEDIKYGVSFYRGNRNAQEAITAWLAGGEGRRVFVLYGAAHLLGTHNLAEDLGAAGMRVIVLVPLLPEWEAAIRRRGEPDSIRAWLEVAPNVLRAPLVTDDELLALPPPKQQ